MYFPKIIVHFMPEWAHKQVGVSFGEDYYFDHRVRVDARLKIERRMFDIFGDAGLGQEFPKPNPDIDCCGGILGKAVFGIPITFNEGRAIDVHPLNITQEEMASFKLPDDFAGRFPLDRMTRQIEGIRREYAKCNPTYDLFHHGVVNLGLDIRGNELFMDVYERPDELKSFFARLGDGLLRVADYSESAMGKMPFYKLGHCSMCMFAPEFYTEFILDVDARLARRVQPFGIHHHGRTDNGHLDAYKELEIRSGVEIELFDLDWNADFRYFRKLFPKAHLFYLMDPAKIAEGDADSYRREVERTLSDLGGAENMTFTAGDLDDRVSPEQVRSLVAAIEERAK